MNTEEEFNYEDIIYVDENDDVYIHEDMVNNFILPKFISLHVDNEKTKDKIMNVHNLEQTYLIKDNKKYYLQKYIDKLLYKIIHKQIK